MAATEFIRRPALRPYAATFLATWLVVLAGCGYTDEQVKRKTAEKMEGMDQGIVRLFLDGIVHRDYAGAQILMKKHTPMLAGAKDAAGRTEVLKDYVNGWLKDHGLADARLKSFGFHEHAPNASDGIDFDHTGEFELSAPEGRVVYFRVRTVDYRVESIELSGEKLRTRHLPRQGK